MKHVAAPQLRLFDAVADLGPQRHELDELSWLDHIPGWYPEAESLFDAVEAQAVWEQRSRWMFTKAVIEPRLTAEFPVLAEAPVLELRRVGEMLSRRYDVRYDSAWVNLYRNHDDSTAWHADRLPSRREISIVPVLSLGATRRFLVRPKRGGRSLAFTVASGDLIVMGGRCQRDWVHAVPKETQPSGPRISINFGSSSQATKA